MTSDQIAAAAASAAKQTIIASPSIGAILLAWMQAPLTTWQVRLGAAFIVLQLLYLARKWWREEFPKRKRAKGAADDAQPSTGPGDL